MNARPKMRTAATIATAVVAALVWGGACGGQPSGAESAAHAQPELGPLPLLLPSGAELVVVARPSALFEAAAARHVIDAVYGPEQRDAFGRRTGIELDELTEVVVGDYGDGFVIIARGPWAARDVVLATESRMNAVEVRSDTPFVRRSGFLGAERRDVSAIANDVVLVTAGRPDVAATILARVRRGRFAEGEPVLAGADVAGLFARHEAAPLAVYVPAPLRLPPGSGTSLLLARERALVAVAEPAGPERLAFGMALVGDFPPGADANFEALIRSMADSDLGAALGMREGLQTLRIQEAANEVQLGLEVRVATLALGLRMLFGGDIEELLAAP